jgi:hypothetical protein
LKALLAFLSVVVSLVVFLAIAPDAMACPSCAGRDDGGGSTQLIVYAAMILTPFAATAIVIRYIRSISSPTSVAK